jgi:hypothetical protein
MASFGWFRAMTGRALAAAGLLLAFGAAFPVSAQVLPIGPDFQVNEYTTGSQQGSLVTTAPDGSFTIVWCCGEAPPGSFDEPVVARRFDALGQPLGGEFLVSQYGNFSYSSPSGIGADSAGDFVVVWGRGRSGCPGCWDDYVKARRFTADAQPLGDQFAVSPPPGSQYTGSGNVAVAPGGGFVVAWEDYGAWARRYDAGGTPLGEPFQIGGENGYSHHPVIAPQPADGFVIAWNDWNATTQASSLLAQRYDAGGLPLGSQTQVSELTRFWTYHDLSSGPAGDFVVAWVVVPVAHQYGIAARRFGADGSPLGPSQIANSLQGVNAWAPAVRHLADGGFVVAWESVGSGGTDTSNTSIQARAVAADGVLLGLQLQLNAWTPTSQFWPALAMQPNGDLVVTWSSVTSPGSDSDMAIIARRFRPAFFMDGFETGDASRWSMAIP